jgi:hypothetical protein
MAVVINFFFTFLLDQKSNKKNQEATISSRKRPTHHRVASGLTRPPN